MNQQSLKKHPTLGCCGLDCGLCPRYYTEGSSRCPGCCGPDFFNKHPSCGFITCCVKKKNLEVCSQCADFPCSKFDDWFGKKTYDSFLTHKKAEPNLFFIKEKGLDKFIKQQQKRIELLEQMLQEFNDGRSKSYYCMSSTLLSIPGIEQSIQEAKEKIKTNGIEKEDMKQKAKILKEILEKTAKKEKVELKLNKPPNWK
jgi:hypothetical protein